MREEYPQEIEYIRKHLTTIWRRDEMVVFIEEAIEGLQQKLDSKYKTQKRIEWDTEVEVFWKQLMNIPKWRSERIES